MGILYGINNDNEVIGLGNIIHFCYYNSNRISGNRSNMIEISNANVIVFWFNVW